MFSHKLTRFIAAGAAVVAVGGATYGTVNAVSGGGSSTAGAATTAKVIPFDRGNPSASTVVGQVPQGWSAGSGTIVTGTAANKAKAAAVAAYPGGIVNRVVLLSNGDYNVHVIGVNWPHHVFVNKDFKVIGAE
ncbi:MAG: hypothetical protein QOD60_576 [Solirubrobacterales bacterium]|jgi:hypothetical protein|nr:hypothetical protein [Solirubrobacterales bacterium]